MSTASATELTGRVLAAVAGVPDPELPPVTLGMLGMVHEVEVTDATARVVLLPTWAGCPAQEMMTRDVRAAVLAVDGIEAVEVTWSFDPVWTPARIDATGRRQLASFGIAPPGDATAPTAGRRGLPLAGDVRPCPYCGSTDTVLDAAFGPTPCRDLRFCNACRQPFEGFKAH